MVFKNEGEDALKPDVYGPTITFYRTILDSGPSAVYIKDWKDNIVKKSTKEAREEGKRIVVEG